MKNPIYLSPEEKDRLLSTWDPMNLGLKQEDFIEKYEVTRLENGIIRIDIFLKDKFPTFLRNQETIGITNRIDQEFWFTPPELLDYIRKDIRYSSFWDSNKDQVCWILIPHSVLYPDHKVVTKDIHTEHCCAIHGCKYGEEDICTVWLGYKPQSYPYYESSDPIPVVSEEEFQSRRDKLEEVLWTDTK